MTLISMPSRTLKLQNFLNFHQPLVPFTIISNKRWRGLNKIFHCTKRRCRLFCTFCCSNPCVMQLHWSVVCFFSAVLKKKHDEACSQRDEAVRAQTELQTELSQASSSVSQLREKLAAVESKLATTQDQHRWLKALSVLFFALYVWFGFFY